MLLKTVKTLMLAMLALSFGLVQAASDGSQRDMPATPHQVQSLDLQSGADSNPRYQFKRRGSDYAAVMPVTHHQADVLKLRNVTSGDRNAQHS